jgi:hypothetical protein
MRSAPETSKVTQFSVSVDPLFPNADDALQNDKKLAFELQLRLATSKNWVKAPEFIMLNNAGIFD